MPRTPKTAAASATTPTTNPAPASKIEQVITLLRREQGATLPEMVAATGWQTHSTRAALTGLRKKGHTLAKDKRDDVTCYRIGTAA